MGITILKNNAPWGPFTRAQIEEGLKRGDFTLQYLAHAPGEKEWLPLGEVLDRVEQSALLPPLPAAQNLPPVPPPMPSPEALRTAKPLQVPVLPPAQTDLSSKAAPVIAPSPPPVPARPEAQLDTASFFLRGIAFLIDCAILFVPILFLFSLSIPVIWIQSMWEHTDKESVHQEWLLLERNFFQLLLLVAIGLGWLYAAGLECSRWQATVGKKWMGIKVTDRYGERLGFLRASGRHAAKYLSALPCFLGFMMALFSSRGLSLHDRLAKTRVVRR